MDTRILRPNPFSLALILALVSPAGLRHNYPRPVFVYTFHPDVPVSRFVAGQLGIPEPRHARLYHFVSYRYLEGKPLSAEEQHRWLKVWDARTTKRWPEWKGDQAWISARRKLPIPFEMDRFRPADIRQRLFTSSNVCNEDSFAAAARTLEDRARRFGPASPEMKFWVAGQDAVFEACVHAEPQQIPPAPASLPPLLRADREYQIAAATFYSQRFDEAAAAFRRIAADPASPWRFWAPYQVGRALLYKARQTQSDEVYKIAVAHAETQFRAVIANPSLRQSHAAAEYLLLRCMLITRHRDAIERIGLRLLRGDWAETDLSLYLNGMDEYSGTPQVQWPRDPISRWILAFQKGLVPPNPTSRAWLYATLWHKSAGSVNQIEAAMASGAIPLRYLAARHLARQGSFQQARAALAPVLAAFEHLPSAKNLALQLHTQLAPTWDDFLQRAPRTVIFASSEVDSDEWQSSAVPDLEQLRYQLPKFREQIRQSMLTGSAKAAALAALPRWDESAFAILNQRCSLRVLLSAANSDKLPGHLRDDLALVVFTRAVLLNRWAEAREVAPRIPSPKLTEFLKDPTEDTAAMVLLDLPGARPFVSFGYGRNRPVSEHAEYLSNWWSRIGLTEALDADLAYPSHLRNGNPALNTPLPFLTPEQLREADQEWDILRKSGQMGLNWIADKTVTAVRANPTRPGAAERLYRVVIASRRGWWSHGSADPLPEPATEAAAQLLQTRYRNTKWDLELKKLEDWEIPARIIR